MPRTSPRPRSRASIPAQRLLVPGHRAPDQRPDPGDRLLAPPRRYNIWSTESGTSRVRRRRTRAAPPYPSPVQAAIYLNESEYLSYRNPRVASYAQYLLNDPAKLKNTGLFASGLYTDRGAAKPALTAYRMPVWLPKQRVKKGQSALIWGGARPAPAGYAATKARQQVQVQQRQGGAWQTIATVTVSRTTGYSTTYYRFTRSGSVRLAFSYPSTGFALPVGVAGIHDLQPRGPGDRSLKDGGRAA